MGVPLRNRADLKAAGRGMADEAVELLARHLISLTPDELADEAQIDHVVQKMIQAMEATAETYRQAGIPSSWIEKFRNAFIRHASEKCRGLRQAVNFAIGPAAGNA